MLNPNINEKEDNIGRVKDSLYTKNPDGIFVKRRHNLADQKNLNVPTEWSVEEEQPESTFKIPYTKILFGAFIFFVLALVFAFSRFFMGSNVVSGNNIDILVSGPVSIAGGEELPLDIQIINKNNIDLNSVTLRIEYPDGTKSIANSAIDFKRYSESIGVIKVGKNEKRLVKAILYGEENSKKMVKITAEYMVSGSSAVFTKEKDFDVLIASSPVNIKVTAPSEINSNQLTDFYVVINSNSTTVVKNLILKIDYPFGFTLGSSDPKPSNSDGSVFSIGDLAPGAKRTIRVSGAVAGQDGEERSFKFSIGNPSKDDSTIVGTLLASYLSTVTLKRSSIGLDITVNEDSSKEVAIIPGAKNRVGILWKNNLGEKLYDTVIRINLSGSVLDKSSIAVDNGYYNSSNNSIIFDKTSNPELAEINPNAEGDMQFSFGTLFPSSNSPISFGNSSVKFDVNVSGNRTGDGGATSETLYSETKTLKVSSNLKLLSRGFRTVGPFENSGPFPPRVDNETTYTITWTATDSFNNITGAKVSATLAPNVKWTGFTSPGSENITYDKSTGEVVWNVGDMRSGIGTNSQARDVSFQVSVTPSISQVGFELQLVGSATISGIDAFTGVRIGEVKGAVTTNITSDPEYVNDIGKVVQ